MRELLETALHGRYTIDRQLGQGGMGAVYLAEDQQLQRPVAIKLLPPEFAARDDLRERFLRETRVTASFSHPNIVPVFAVEEHAELLCFVMGFIEGETLGQRVRRVGPFNAADAIKLIQEVAWALSYAHSRGVVHRDIKPENILVELVTGRALVTDFGIARTASTTTSSPTLTRVGEVVGTPQFMSPEQAAGEKLDGRSDIYSLGVVAFFAVTGRLPFDADSAPALMAMHLTQSPPKVASLRPDLPQALAAAIDRCLEKEPAKRFETGEALAAALEPLRASRPEIAPALRLFQVQAVQGFRALIILAFLEFFFLARPLGNGNGDFLLPIIIGAAVAFGIISQMISSARGLLRGGFALDHATAGMRAIVAEQLEARALDAADPYIRRQQSGRRRTMIAGGIYGVAGGIWVLFVMRTKTGPDTYTIGLAGSLVLLSAAIMLGLSLSLFVMTWSRATMLDRVVAMIWRGPFGRFAFSRAERGLRRRLAGVAPSAATSSVQALIADLPNDRRRSLGDSKQRVQKLERVLAGFDERRRSLDEAIAQAGAPTPTGNGAASALNSRGAELRDDLANARRSVIARRERLVGALENVRLQLLRLKGGVGSSADVAAELAAAEAIVGE